jgi:hypothetical protein
MARGSLTGNARRDADGGWVVDNLRLTDIRLQSDKSLKDFLHRSPPCRRCKSGDWM